MGLIVALFVNTPKVPVGSSNLDNNQTASEALKEAFRNKSFIVDLSGALEDKNGKKDIGKIDKLLNLFTKI